MRVRASQIVRNIIQFFRLRRTGRPDPVAGRQRLGRMIDQAPVGIYESWSTGAFRSMNREMARILGFDGIDQALSYYNDIGRQLYVDPTQRAQLFDLLERNGRVQRFPVEAYRVDGERISISTNAAVIERHPGKGLLISGFVVDETRQRRAERRLAQSREEYRSVVQLAREIIVRFDPDGRWSFLNAEACRFFGSSREELLGRRFIDYVHPDDRARTLQAGVELTERRLPVEGFENRQWTPAGWQIVEWNTAPILGESGECIGVQAIGRNITEQRLMDEKLRHREEQYRQLFHSIRDAILVAGTDRRIVNCNRALTELFGYTLEEIEGAETKHLYASEAEYARAGALIRANRDRESFFFTVEYRTKSGHVFPGETNVFFRRDAEGNPTAFIGLIRDVTERKRREEELHNKERKWRALFEQATVGIMLARSDHRVVDANERAAQLLGYSRDELRELSAADLIHPEEYARRPPDETLRAMIRDDRSVEIERRFRRESGDYINALVSMTRLEGLPQEISHVIMFSDISERKQAEERLRASLEERDSLMAELSHRVKNNLAMVSSLISLKDGSLGEAADLSDIQQHIEAVRSVYEMLHSTDRVTHIEFRDYVDQLLRKGFATGRTGGLSIEVKVPDVTLPAQTAMRLGIIINELATNAVKHGFTGEEPRRFTVELSMDEAASLWVLQVSNTGSPFPSDIDPDTTDSLGLRLVSALVSQLDGTLDLQREPHPVFTIRFPNNTEGGTGGHA